MCTKNIGRLLLAVLLLSIAACCDKDAGPLPDITSVTDQQNVRVKEIVVRNSPSPYYHFTYDDSGYVTTLRYSDDLYVYDYFYKNRRIDSVTTSSTDARYLLYRYNDHKVTSVLQYDNTGLRQTVSIKYDNRNRVIRMEWQPTSSPPFEKFTEFEYYDNGNVSHMKTTYPASGTTSTVTYEAYDNKMNVDGFGIYQDFFDHLIFLPAVKFQQNNPTRMKVVSGPNERTIQHDYTYQGSLPIQRNSTTQVTSGPGSGQNFTAQTTFSYY